MKKVFLVLVLAALVAIQDGPVAYAQSLPEVRCGINPAKSFAQLHNSILRHYNILRLNHADQNSLRKKVEELQKRRHEFERALASTNAHSLKYKNPMLLFGVTDCLEDFFLHFYNARVKVEGNGDPTRKSATTYNITDLKTGRRLFWDVDGYTIYLNTFMKDNYLMDLLVTKEEVAIDLINDGISKYPGRCPCPYNVDVNGANCGNRSAWSRSGGRNPRCYVKDYSENYLMDIRRRVLLMREDYD